MSSDPLALLERHGHVPLPPYITHADSHVDDERRYQTVFAARPGAVAAPTAALHFDEAAAGTRWRCSAACGARASRCTWGPVPSSRCADGEHRLSTSMHSEWFEVPAGDRRRRSPTRAPRGGRVVAVGTTTAARAGVAALGGTLAAGSTRHRYLHHAGICLPGRRRAGDQLPPAQKHVDDAGQRLFRPCARDGAVPSHAIAERYRFFSYGDAMLLTRRLDRAEATVDCRSRDNPARCLNLKS